MPTMPMYREKPYYAQSFDDIESCKEGIAKDIAGLQEAIHVLEQIRLHHAKAESRPCPFCFGTMRYLGNVTHNLNWFGVRGGSYASLQVDFYEYPPREWECQDCLSHDISEPPEKARLWSREKPGKDTFAKQVFQQRPEITQVAYYVRSEDRPWMVETAESWWAIPGVKGEVAFKLSLPGSSKIHWELVESSIETSSPKSEPAEPPVTEEVPPIPEQPKLNRKARRAALQKPKKKRT